MTTDAQQVDAAEVYRSIGRLEGEVSQLTARLEREISQLTARLEGEISQLTVRLEREMSQLTARMDRIEQRLDRLIFALFAFGGTMGAALAAIMVKLFLGG